jgi:hypothetical protein
MRIKPMLRFALCLLIVICATPFLHADDPVQPPERIPAPQQLVQPAPVYLDPYTPRTGSIEVWQHYGVNRLGRFVPRVIQFPEGAYYSRDLQPYPWAASRPAAVMPYAVD